MSGSANPEFGRVQALLWPIYGYELKKFIPMLLLFFFITFNYTILRDTKDTLIVTTAGAEALPFIKMWGTMPAAIFFMILYAQLCNVFNKETLFYFIIAGFLLFFLLFTLFLYPNRNHLCPTSLITYLEAILPKGLGGLISCIKHWTFTLFDVAAELWGVVVLSLLFWGFANDTTKISEAKRFYALFGIGANLSLLVSGPLSIYVSNIRSKIPEHIDAWHVSLQYITGFVIIAGLAIMGIYWWIHRFVLTDQVHYNPEEIKKREAKTKIGLCDSLKYLLSSKYILCIAGIVICYGICTNLLEVTWKAQLQLMYPHPNDYNTFMGYFSSITGICTLLMMLFVGGNLLRKSWFLAAVITPIAMLITGAIFFGTILYPSIIINSLFQSPLQFIVVIGLIQNVLCKAAKYSLLDPSKEMVYIPLDNNTRTKGKAVIDLVGSRFGKSGGSLIQQIFLIFFGSLSAITPYIALILFFIILVWIACVHFLNIQFLKLSVYSRQE